VVKTILVSTVNEDDELFFCLFILGILTIHSLLDFLDLYSRVQSHLAHQELPVAKFADCTPRFLPIGIDSSSRKHPLFLHALLAVTVPTELAEVHLRAFFKYEVSTSHASSCPCLFATRPIQEEDWVFFIQLKLFRSNTQHILLFETFQFCSQFGESLLHLQLIFKLLKAVIEPLINRFSDGADADFRWISTRRKGSFRV